MRGWSIIGENEGAFQKEITSMGWTETGMNAKYRVELISESFVEKDGGLTVDCIPMQHC
jgi:hypothetical protein